MIDYVDKSITSKISNLRREKKIKLRMILGNRSKKLVGNWLRNR